MLIQEREMKLAVHVVIKNRQYLNFKVVSTSAVVG